MSTARRLALPVLLLTAVAARAGEFECPARGGSAWREVRTAHLAVLTDLESEKAQELAREIERLHEVVRFSLFRQPPEAPGMMRVVAMRGLEFDLFASKDVAAYYISTTDLGPTIVLPGYMGDAQRSIVAHELTHHLLARAFARQPRWFSEGMASFMETVGTNGPKQSPTLGGLNVGRYRKVFPYHGGMAAVLGSTGQLDERGYGMAWALVHFLFNRNGPEFGQLQQRFARGQDPTVAWREVFPAWDPSTPNGPAALDDAVGRYLSSGKFRFREIRLPPEREVTERPLTASDAHANRLSLPWINRGEPKEVATAFSDEVDEALGHDPGNVVALRLLARRKGQETQGFELAEKAVATHPEDSRAWLFLSRNLPKEAGERRLEVLAKAVALDPANAAALKDYAWLLLAAGRSGEALPMARQAVALEPWNSAILATFAGVLEDLGRCKEALEVQYRAVDVLPERMDHAERRAYLDLLEKLEKGCGEWPAPKARQTGG